MEKIPLLLLRLEAPLQSWGDRARWRYRNTGNEPTKSGIVGLLSCALGYKRGDSRIIDLDKSLKMGVRIEQEGEILEDFCTVKVENFTRANGKSKDKTELIYKDYLQNACFLVVLSGETSILKKLKNALLRPYWSLYLGRKACVPSRPIFDSIINKYSSIEEALEKISWATEFNFLYPEDFVAPESLRCIVDDPNGELTRNDIIKNSPTRIYGSRRVKEYWIKTPKILIEIEKTV